MSLLVAVDPGTVRIGVAVADDELRIAMPRETVRAGKSPKESAQRVALAIGADEVVSGLVVGLPMSMSGREGESARRARLLGDALGEQLGVEPVYMDERWTTQSANEALREMKVR